MVTRLLIAVCLVVLVACQKGDPGATTPTPPPPPLSPGKAIASAVLKAADNTALPTDVSGSVSADSVTFTVPRNTPLSALVPTIAITGASITPAAKTPQDFTNPVVYTIKAENGTQKTYTFWVSRQLSDTDRLLVGKWALLRDSLWETDNFFYTDGTGNHHPTPGVYYAAPTEYWEFGANGRLAVKENGMQFNKGYSLTADSRLHIEGLTPYFDTATIDTLTTSALSFYWNKTGSNGGRYFRKVYLKR